MDTLIAILQHYVSRLPGTLQSLVTRELLPRISTLLCDLQAALTSGPSISTILPVAISAFLLYATVMSVLATARFAVRTTIWAVKWGGLALLLAMMWSWASGGGQKKQGSGGMDVVRLLGSLLGGGGSGGGGGGGTQAPRARGYNMHSFARPADAKQKKPFSSVFEPYDSSKNRRRTPKPAKSYSSPTWSQEEVDDDYSGIAGFLGRALASSAKDIAQRVKESVKEGFEPSEREN